MNQKKEFYWYIFRDGMWDELFPSNLAVKPYAGLGARRFATTICGDGQLDIYDRRYLVGPIRNN